MRLRPVIEEAALVVENRLRTLVVADLHMGIEAELRQRGINIGSQTERLMERILNCIKETAPDAIVLLGDIKHAVPGISFRDRREIPQFLATIAEYAPVHVVKGNHDSQLEGLLPDTSMHTIQVERTRGFVFDGAGYVHGHTWPARELFSAEYIIIAHNHPMIRLMSRSTSYTKLMSVWIRARCDYDAVMRYYRDMERDKEHWHDPWVIIMPAFNEICGGVAVNAPDSKLMGPIASKLILTHTMEAYLLDGTYIGRVMDLL